MKTAEGTRNGFSELDIPHPYCNWEGLKDLFKGETTPDMISDVFRACHGITSQATSYELLKDTPYLTFGEARKLVTCIFANIIKSGKVKKPIDISIDTGIDYSYLCKFNVSGKISDPYYWKELDNGEKRLEVNDKVRPFSLPFTSLPAFCANVTHSTCHELMFGEKRPIFLPHVQRSIAAALETVSEKNIKALIKEGIALRDKAVQTYITQNANASDSTVSAEFGQYRPEHVVVRERLLDLSHDLDDLSKSKYVFFYDAKAPNKYMVTWNATMRGSLAFYGSEGKNTPAEETQYLPNLEMAMFWALATRLDPSIPEKNLDYFICNDYIQIPGGATPYVVLGRRSPIMTYGNDGEPVEITDTDILKVLSFCIALPDDVRGDYIGKVFALAKKKAIV